MKNIEKKTANLKNLQSGMSLIEIIISIFLVLIIFDLCLMEVNVLTISRKQRYENIAYHIAKKQMESLRTASFDSLPESSAISDPMLNEIPSGSGNFTISDYPGYSGIKEIVVTVNWNYDGNKSATIKTLAGRGGINP